MTESNKDKLNQVRINKKINIEIAEKDSDIDKDKYGKLELFENGKIYTRRLNWRYSSNVLKLFPIPKKSDKSDRLDDFFSVRARPGIIFAGVLLFILIFLIIIRTYHISQDEKIKEILSNLSSVIGFMMIFWKSRSDNVKSINVALGIGGFLIFVIPIFVQYIPGLFK